MTHHQFRCIVLVSAIWLFFQIEAISQLPFGLKYPAATNTTCAHCLQMIDEKPPEVLFGIEIDSVGNVYFSMENLAWFNKIFPTDQFGVAVDIVAKERYNCDVSFQAGNGEKRGQILNPVYKPAMIKNNELALDNYMHVKVGTVPEALRNQQLEGNLLILNGALVCYYTNFVNIDRNVWALLPMGLFTDTLVQTSATKKEEKANFFTYSGVMKFVIPFNKNKTVIDRSDLQPMIDSLSLHQAQVKKIEIRAYASVEGPEANNNSLMKARGQAIFSVLKAFQPSLNRYTIITAENWLDFFRDIATTPYKTWTDLSKQQIKTQLADKAIGAALEPMLYNERKALVTLYIDHKSTMNLTVRNVLPAFNDAIKKKDIAKARRIQRELVDMIADNSIPATYINQLEIPPTAEYIALAADKEVYRLMLNNSSHDEALSKLKALKKLDPANGRLNYNICALSFDSWQAGDSTIGQQLLPAIQQLTRQGIDPSLVRRMLINYYILTCEGHYLAYRYAAKDSSLQQIRQTYQNLPLTDVEIFSLVKYLTFYAKDDWAEALIRPRIDQLDVSEDLVFYYLNLLFFKQEEYAKPYFTNAMLNAVNLNRQRFCNFFLPQDKGGASMQLLEAALLRQKYCETCK